MARIRAGDHAYAWQTNGTEVALRYATDVIGWDSVVVLDRSGDTYELLGCDLLPAIGCDAEDLARLTVAEALIRDGIGVWGVTNIELEKGIAPAPSPGATPPAPSPDPTGVQADAERIALAFARSRVSEHRPDLFLKGSAADAYHSNRGGLSLAADYLGFNVGGSEMLEGRRVRVWIGLVTEVTSEGCWQTIYERVIIASGKVVDARLEDVGSRECGTR